MAALQRRALAILLLAAASCNGQDGVDEAHPERTVTKIAFSSCVKAWKPQQPLWDAVEAFDPDVFLWTGDAVYANGTTLRHLEAGLAEQLSRRDYQAFLRASEEKGRVVDGVWDDHDLGVNDGGAEVPDIPARQSFYLDFLGLAPDAPRRGRSGLYKSITFGSNPRQVKVILLDVRSFRDHYVIPSVGGWFHWYPPVGKFMPFVAAITRWLGRCKLFGSEGSQMVELRGSGASVLGAEQWRWLEEELRGSNADATVVVSSTQVLTSNPIFEGWGHFPYEKRRLLKLLESTNTKGAVLISGDVHHGEIAAERTADGRVLALEITASGATHSIATSKKTQKVYPPIIMRYHRQRLHPQQYYTGLNYGTLEIEWPEEPAGEATVTASVRSLKRQGDPVVQVAIAPEEGGSRVVAMKTPPPTLR